MEKQLSNSNERILIGNRVVIQRRGAKGTWTASFSLCGVHRRKSLHTRDKRIAMQRAAKIAADLESGEFRPAAPATTIQEGVTAYMDFLRIEGRAKGTIDRYQIEFDTFIEFAERNHIWRMSAVTPRLMDAWRAERREGHALLTLHHECTTVKQLFRWAYRRQLTTPNPLENYELTKPPRNHKAVLTLTVVNTILQMCSPQRLAELAVLAFTGMRSGELQGLRRENVDLKDGWIAIVGQIDGRPTKTKAARKVPIHPRLLAILKSLPPREHDLFFTSEPSPRYPQGGRPINKQRLNIFFKSKVKLAGEEKFTVHDLRHFFKSFAVNNSVPERAVDLWLGHSDSSVRAAYYHLRDEESKVFMNKLPFGTDQDT